MAGAVDHPEYKGKIIDMSEEVKKRKRKIS